MDDLYSLMNNWRKLLNESADKGFKEDEQGAVPYSNQDELLNSITDTAKTQFGADFSKFKTPMLYYPKDGDVTLSGEISSLNNAKFQFRYKDTGDGCYIWMEPLHLNDETLRRLSVIYGVFKNWKDELDSAEDIKPMNYRDENGNNNTNNEPMVPGDDF